MSTSQKAQGAQRVKRQAKRQVARQAAPQVQETHMSFRLSRSLRELIRVEAKKDSRTSSNMVMRLCVEALQKRGVFLNRKIQ